MKKLSMVRIDDRLIHGQIATQWLKTVHANKILIIDDKLPTNELQKRILKAAAPPNIKVVIKNSSEGVEYCLKEPINENENIMVLVKTPEIIEKLLDGGVLIPQVILGGMGYKENRIRINRNISASTEEIECMKRIRQSGTEIIYQLVPDEMAQDFDSILNKLG